ncbi:LOW QUALITY PROTEIN: protein Red-like [Bolinopsis microptera]|uniref:LOW QUALITY PROTEIN: protein Red-like n=1 Tax=Bolinopsis microptera TaxID=2820187 RepID=UPI00307A1950
MPPVAESTDQPFSNPVAPAHLGDADDAEQDNLVTTANLTNADFRKMLMTPAPKQAKVKPQVTIANVEKEKLKERERRLKEKKKKKGEYLEYKKTTEARQKELAELYRDRAGERDKSRRVLKLSEASQANQYAPAGSSIASVADRRKQTIQESKFLGGDMEHTHLVKGLDFALLQKMREEITRTDHTEAKTLKSETAKTEEPKKAEEGIKFKTKMGQSIYRAVFVHKHPERNELFAQNRMAYQVELDDEYAETDIPTTLIRSKAEAKASIEKRTLTNNDIVINKLTQILSYLRQGNRYGKQKFKKKEKRKFETKAPTGPAAATEDDIFGGLGEYVPPGLKNPGKKMDQKPMTYFNEVTEKSRQETEAKAQAAAQKRSTDARRMRLDAQQPEDSYMECYPGAMEESGAAYDSDEDADYTKMDMGNKKGPLTRWDFEDEDKYNAYMEKREAMPKAAFQFGIKMSDGRKTKRQKPVDEKQKLDREMQRINQMINKRKAVASGDMGVPEKIGKY